MPSNRDWRAGTHDQAARLSRLWLEKRETGRAPGRSMVSLEVWYRNEHAFSRFSSLPRWEIERLAHAEAAERSRRAIAVFNETVEKPSRHKAGEMV